MNKSRILGVFDDEEKLVSSVRNIQKKGFKIDDVISPYPIHELFDELKLKSRIPMAAFIYGVFAFVVTFGFLYWTSVVNYPLVFGGKPQNTLSFIIVIFVMIIFVTTLFTILTFFISEKKGPGAKVHFEYPGITDDRFVIIIDKAADTDVSAINQLLHDGGAVEVKEQQSIK
jgi:hypothetical protein